MMAQIGSTPPASRYSGLAVGPRMAYLFETQDSIPVDGTNARLRNLSPFTLRFVLPPDLSSGVSAAPALNAVAEQARSVNVIGRAVNGTNFNTLNRSTARSLYIPSSLGSMSDGNNGNLATFVAQGAGVVEGQTSGFIPTLADAYTAADIALQLQRLIEAEPLTLLVNPNNMSTTYNKIQSFQQRTRKGYVFQAWGEEQPTISFSGSTAGFVSGSSGTDDISRGYQNSSMRDSAAWQNFMALYEFYRNNGYIYDTINKTEAHLFIGSIAIEFDQMTYIGNIDSFEFTFDASEPHRVEFSMEFHVSQMYDNATSYSTVSPETSGNLGPGEGVSLNTTDSSLIEAPQVTATLPFDLLPG